ncbi:MAG: hypothetical protein KGI90_17310 [Burkholderiales bacterium]|nr:hypothetical protein [Burkholderiales bacterium]
MTRYQNARSDQPDAVVSNTHGDRVEYWSGIDSQGVIVPRQARLSLLAGRSYRVHYSAAGVPERIVDEASGDFVTQTFVDDSLIIQAHHANGQFVGGFKVTRANNRVSLAPIVGQAYFSGQLALDLNGGVRSASAVLVPASQIVVGQASELPAAYQTFLNGGTPVAAWMPRHSQSPLERFVGIVFSTAHAQSTGGRQVASGIAQSATGAVLAVASYYAPAIASVTLGAATASIVGPVLAGGLFIAAGWNLANGVSDIVGGGIKLVSDTGDRFSDGVDPMDSLTQQAALIGRVGSLSNVVGAVVQAVGRATDVLSTLVSSAGLTPPGPAPMAPSTPVTGSAVDSSGSSLSLSGTVSSRGAFSAQGQSGVSQLGLDGTIDANGQATGSFVGYLGNGTATGGTSPFGQCQQITNSGGRGTFVRAHNLGLASGTTTFSYDAYSIPDQFTVSTNGQTAFGTPGLVSGRGGANIALNGSSIVFVAVNAPNTGTAWQYQLSCPQ